MVTTSTGRKVHAIAHSLGLKELGEVEGNGNNNTRNEIEKCPT